MKEPQTSSPARSGLAAWKRRCRILVINGTLVVVSTLVACGVGEVLVRVAAPQQLIVLRPDIWMPVEGLGWRHRPEVRTSINTGERTVGFFTDHDGFRVGRDGRREAGRRILLLGDSFMAAWQVEYEESLAGLLEAGLAERLGEPVALHNAAVGGWGPSQYLLEARAVLERNSYDALLVALYLGNDIASRRQEGFLPRAPAIRKSFRLPRSLAKKEIVGSLLRPLNDSLEGWSHLFVLAKNRTGSLRMRLGLSPAYLPRAILRSEAESAAWAVTAEICRDIEQLASQRGTPAVFLQIPAPYQVIPEILEAYLHGFGIDPDQVDLGQPNRLLGGLLRDLGLAVVDPLAALRREAAGESRPYGAVDSHFTSRGHEIAARSVEDTLFALLKDGQSTASTETAATNSPLQRPR